MCVYLMKADKSKMQATLDHYINGFSSVYRFKPLAGFVMGVFADMQKVSSKDKDLGHMHEIDVSVFMPVLAWCKNHWELPKLVTFVPYLFVNNCWAMATGRETIGFRKEIGLSWSDKNPDCDSWKGAFDLTRVEAYVMLKKGADQKLTAHNLLELKTPGDIRKDQDNAFRSLEEAFDYVIDFMIKGEADITRHLPGLKHLHLFPDRLNSPMVFLKQFRDAEYPEQACYQSIVMANAVAKLDTFRGGGLLDGDYQLRVNSTASHPIADELGLKEGNNDVSLAYWVDVDFDFNPAFYVS